MLARHLIQSFLPNETTPEQAHQIGLALCNKILKDEYECKNVFDKLVLYNAAPN